MTEEKSADFRIHGDNILECETALRLIVESICSEGLSPVFKKSAVYAPVYGIKDFEGNSLQIQLFPGYGRWKFDISKYLSTKGASLREATDAVVTRVSIQENGVRYETPILALEFCGALPAGNNAWQRCGRALSLAYAKVPYLYFAELGGVELDGNRNIKAPRFPNPLVPFAYLVLGEEEKVLSLPVYLPSPSIGKELNDDFSQYFGKEDAKLLIQSVLLSGKDGVNRLKWKAERIVELLASKRKGNGTLGATDWNELSAQKSGLEKAEWLIEKKMPWSKKTGISTLTKSFKKLLKTIIQSGAVAAGSKEMPFCLLDKSKRHRFAQELKSIYGSKIDQEFQDWIAAQSRPLLCVWVAGFKPRGDDSRPDRGLVPLARMVFGRKIDVLTIIYGPAKESALNQLKKNKSALARSNGLWESVLNLSNALIVDSSSGRKLSNVGFLIGETKKEESSFLLPASSETPSFGEHDVDSVLHLIFSDQASKEVYESICNPPGGDWSGVSIVDFDKEIEYRWTSLPRVSGAESKRPDHLVQFKSDASFLSIESKENFSSLEKKIGPRLKKYAKDLIAEKPPICYRSNRVEAWKVFTESFTEKHYTFFSGAAFISSSVSEMKKALVESEVDIVIGVEFIKDSIQTKLHVVSSKNDGAFLGFIKRRVMDFPESILLEIHQ